MVAILCVTVLTLFRLFSVCRAFTHSATLANAIVISHHHGTARIDLSTSERPQKDIFAEALESNSELDQCQNQIEEYYVAASSDYKSNNQVETDLLRRTQSEMTTHILKREISRRSYSPDGHGTKIDRRATSVGERRVGSGFRTRNDFREISLAHSIVQEGLRKKKEQIGVDEENAEKTSTNLKPSGAIEGNVIDSTVNILNRPTILQPGRTILRESLPASLSINNGWNELIVRIAFPEDDLDIAHLRLSVFSDFTAEQVKQYRARACEVLNTRALRGAICLVVSTNPSPTKNVQNIAGSLEISTHEFDGTDLGLLRPKGSILYVTELAVSPSLRQNGIGTILMKGLDKIAMMQSIETIYLHVDVTNTAAIRLYEKAGYEVLDSENPVFKEFTTKLNLQDGATKGRIHHLLHKTISYHQTWFEASTIKTTKHTLGFRVNKED